MLEYVGMIRPKIISDLYWRSEPPGPDLKVGATGEVVLFSSTALEVAAPKGGRDNWRKSITSNGCRDVLKNHNNVFGRGVQG